MSHPFYYYQIAHWLCHTNSWCEQGDCQTSCTQSTLFRKYIASEAKVNNHCQGRGLVSAALCSWQLHDHGSQGSPSVNIKSCLECTSIYKERVCTHSHFRQCTQVLQRICPIFPQWPTFYTTLQLRETSIKDQHWHFKHHSNPNSNNHLHCQINFPLPNSSAEFFWVSVFILSSGMCLIKTKCVNS